MSGLEIPIIKITSSTAKPIIVIVGRLFPTDSLSSFYIHCLLNLLLSRDALVHKLRENYEIWVIPMLNPDGVVLGNNESNV